MNAVPHPLLATADARPAHVVLHTPRQRWTAAELRDRVARRAGSLPVGPGDVVALAGPRDAQWVVDAHAVGWRGATLRPLDPHLPTDTRDALLEGVQLRLGDLPGAHPRRDADGVDAASWPLAQDRLHIVTSGTTGHPRVVPLSTGQLLFSAMGSALRLGHLPGDRWIDPLPLHHVGGLAILFRCAWYGTTVELHPGFDPAAINHALDAGATHVSLVPAMLERLLDDRGDRPFGPHVRCLLVGGAPTSAAQRARAAALGAPVALTWGMTEAASQVATGFPGDLGSPGVPALPFAQVTAADGVLEIHGPTARGTLRTADRGRVEEGRVHVTGRVDDVILSGGENLDPAEIEATLRQHPAVADAAVAGRPDPRWGSRPHAWLVASGSDRPTDDALGAWVRAHLEPYKAPDRFTWVERLPRNAMGKLLRRALRD